MPPEALVGPVAALALALTIIRALWLDHLRADADDRAVRDQALLGWREQTEATREQTAATNRLADALERAERRRKVP